MTASADQAPEVALRVFSDRKCLEHQVPRGFPERPERLEVVLRGLRQAGIVVEEGADHAGIDAAIAAVHELRYIRRFQEAVEAGSGLLDTGDNPLSEGTWRAARAAIGVSLRAADWVAASSHRTAMAAVRPPGHHAERAMAMGFCFFNNVAVAAEYLLRKHAAQRVAIVDFDVHHGNGTQHLFEEREDVLYASLHRYPFYPGSGAAGEMGIGAGEGTTVNIPLPAGSGDDDYETSFQRILLPALRDFRADILLVSAGFDAWRADPVGGMRVSEKAFEDWGVWLREVGDETCDGRVLAVLEGGYDCQALPALVLAHLAGLAGRSQLRTERVRPQRSGENRRLVE